MRVQPHVKNEPIKVLFLCSGNSARSIMAEAILNEAGQGRFVAYSAGSRPTGKVNRTAIAKLAACGHDTHHLRSKSWDEFATGGAPAFDYVITVCDRAASESCPVWVGSPLGAHWGLPDPAAVEGSGEAVRQAFDDAYTQLERRIAALVQLPLRSMDAAAVHAALAEIGKEP